MHEPGYPFHERISPRQIAAVSRVHRQLQRMVDAEEPDVILRTAVKLSMIDTVGSVRYLTDHDVVDLIDVLDRMGVTDPRSVLDDDDPRRPSGRCDT